MEKQVVNPKALTTRNAADYLNSCGYPVARGSLEVWRCKNVGPKYKKVGRRVFYEQAWLDEFMAGVVVKIFNPADLKSGK